MDSPILTPREKAAVLWAEHVANNTAKDRDDVYTIVAEQFSESELVELTMVCSFRNMRTRLHDSLHLELEGPSFEGIGTAAKVDPKNFKKFVQKLLDDWPDEMPVPNPD